MINNVFKGAGPPAWTAMELHGSSTLVSTNDVYNYGRLGIVCGVRVVGFDNVWSANRGYDLACGIQIWAFDDMVAEKLWTLREEPDDHQNRIDINYGAWPNVRSSRSGIELKLSSSGVVHTAKIAGNRIRFLNTGTTSGATVDWRSCGVSWCRGGDVVTEGEADEDLEISDNIIVGAIANGIQINPYRNVTRLRIRRNSIVNPGAGVANTTFRRGIIAFFPASRRYLLKDAELSDNSMIDTRESHLMSEGIDSLTSIVSRLEHWRAMS